MIAIAFLVSVYLVWKQARKQGLSEEKVLDAFFLCVVSSIVAGRLSYVLSHPDIFGVDWSRMLLFIKYPGLLYIPSVITGIMVLFLLARGVGISALLILDIVSFAMIPAGVIGLFGCLLDNCVENISRPTFSITIVGAIFWVFLTILISRLLSGRAGLAETAKKHGLFFLLYLIFQSASLLMLSGNNWLWLVLVFALGALVVRYKELLKYVYDSISKKRAGTDRNLS